MVVNEISGQECRAVLARASIGRLGCALDNQPYVLPIYLACESDYMYVLSTFGQKIEWMRANPKVCVEVDEIASDFQWVSVIVNGRYQELPEPQYADERARAWKLLETHYRWWQTAFAERQLKAGDSLITPIFFCIRIDSMTGLGAITEPTSSAEATL
jgi:nitroimidazol reductase NimA-like FMN-containing flavoprotein (pyridoxamine 5'-phosphate oxidase superfamily)